MVNESNTFNSLFNKQLISLQGYIVAQKGYVMALHRRIALSRAHIVFKTEVEKNEIEILTYESLNKIAITEKRIEQAEVSFENQLNEFTDDIAEVNEHFDSFLELAKKHQSEDIELKHLLYHANWKSINENVDEKINFYKTLTDAVASYLSERKQ